MKCWVVVIGAYRVVNNVVVVGDVDDNNNSNSNDVECIHISTHTWAYLIL